MLAFSGVYKLLLVLHLVAAIVGFGSTTIAAGYGLQAKKRRGREGLAIAEATYEVNEKVSQWFVYAVPILGILLVLSSDDAWKFSQTWVGLSMGLYIVALAIVHVVHLPNIRRMNALMAEVVNGPPPAQGPPPQVAELEERGKRAGMIGGVLNLMWVAVVVLMVTKPGL